MLHIPRKLVLVILLGAVVCTSCRSEGHRYVDEMAATLEEGARRLTEADDPEQGAQEALEYLEANAVQMRIIQSRFDDTVRTLNRYQRDELTEYARDRLEAIQTILDRVPRPSN